MPGKIFLSGYRNIINLCTTEQKVVGTELGESEPHSISTFHSVVLKYIFIYVCMYVYYIHTVA